MLIDMAVHRLIVWAMYFFMKKLCCILILFQLLIEAKGSKTHAGSAREEGSRCPKGGSGKKK